MLPAEILRIKDYVPEVLREIEHLVTAFDQSEQSIGFMGVNGQKLEMLFVTPAFFGQGYGKRLLNFVLKTYGLNGITINEQNPLAFGFYQHCGFMHCRRSPANEQGGPYPILRLKIPAK